MGGFSGGIKLLDGIPVGGSVEGLKILWPSPSRLGFDVRMSGIAVNLEIPGVLKLDGGVEFFDSEGRQGFRGSARVKLLPLDCDIDAQLMIGRTANYTFFYIFLEAGLPAPIMLFSTGIGIYRLGGLFGLNVLPGRRDNEPWYEGWYKGPPEPSATNARKWADRENRMAFGATVTLGTVLDNGYAVSARVLVVLLIPGPTILLEGRANILQDKKQIADRKTEPLFRALAVLDGEAGTLVMNVEPHYVFPQEGESKGQVIDIQGMTEAFFDFNHSDRWYLNIGVREPREKRIRATILKLFQANSYFMLNPRQLALGAWAGYTADYDVGPARLHLAAWFEADALLVFRPLQLEAQAGLHGELDIRAFGFALGSQLHAQASLKTPTPYDFAAEVHARVNPPVPLPALEVTIPFRYHEEKAPPVPVPLQSVEFISRKVSESWDVATTRPEDAPVVPLDGKPVLSFAKSVHDDGGIGGNIQPAQPERVGGANGPLFDYHLDSVRLEKIAFVNNAWTVDKPVPVYGMWAPVVGAGDVPANTGLMLFVKTPFEASRNTASTSAAEEFTGKYPFYPCLAACVDFDELPVQTRFDWFEHHGITFGYGDAPSVRVKLEIRDARQRAGGGRYAVWTRQNSLYLNPGPSPVGVPPFSISLPRPVSRLRLRFTSKDLITATPYTASQRVSTGGLSYYTGGIPGELHRRNGKADFELLLEGDGITRVELRGSDVDLFEICLPPDPSPGSGGDPISRHNADEAKRWAEEEPLLEHDSFYQLKVTTHVTVDPAPQQPVEFDSGPLGDGFQGVTQGPLRFRAVRLFQDRRPARFPGSIDRPWRRVERLGAGP